MTNQTLEGILKEFEGGVLSIHEGSFKSIAEQRRWEIKERNEAVLAIKKLYLERLPKEKNYIGELEEDRCIAKYNQALADMRKAIENL